MLNHTWREQLNNWRDVEKAPKNVSLEENELGGTEEVCETGNRLKAL